MPLPVRPGSEPAVGRKVPRAPRPRHTMQRALDALASGPLVSPTAPAVRPAHVGEVIARSLAFLGRGTRSDRRFRLEEWVTKFADGTSSTDYVWVRGRYVLVVPVSDGGVVFIRQYRKAAQRTLLMLPWGEIEKGESPLDAGRRELEEETGYSFVTAEVHGPYFDLPDKSTGGHWVVIARGARRIADPAPDDGELICGIEVVPFVSVWRQHIPVLMHQGALRLAGL